MSVQSLYTRNTLNVSYYDKWQLNEEVGTCFFTVEKVFDSKFKNAPEKINRIVYKIHQLDFPPFTFLLNVAAFFYSPLQEQIQTYKQLKETLNNLQNKWPDGDEVQLAIDNLHVIENINWIFSGHYDLIPDSKKKILEYKNPQSMEAPMLKGLNDEGHPTILVRLYKIADGTLQFLTIAQQSDNHWVFKLGDRSVVNLANPKEINRGAVEHLREMMTAGTQYYRIAR